jgi:uncharacterized cysteine cluster protein YcgN (CxxCxxCC family)
MIMLYVVACMSSDPQSCQRIDYPKPFKTKQECNQAFIPAMLAFATANPGWRILALACGKEEIEL